MSTVEGLSYFAFLFLRSTYRLTRTNYLRSSVPPPLRTYSPAYTPRQLHALLCLHNECFSLFSPSLSLSCRSDEPRLPLKEYRRLKAAKAEELAAEAKRQERQRAREAKASASNSVASARGSTTSTSARKRLAAAAAAAASIADEKVPYAACAIFPRLCTFVPSWRVCAQRIGCLCFCYLGRG